MFPSMFPDAQFLEEAEIEHRRMAMLVRVRAKSCRAMIRATGSGVIAGYDKDGRAICLIHTCEQRGRRVNSVAKPV